MKTRAIVLGGGIGGLSAAHELAERGFEVVVYEANPTLGGKARTQPVPGSGTNGRGDLPGEHGFRFYPRFYRHLIDTMRRTPLPGGGTVEDNLRDTTEAAIAAVDRQHIHRFDRRRPTSPYGVLEALELFFADMDVTPGDVTLFALKILQYLASSPARRLAEYERISWWDFLQGDRYSEKFRKYLSAIPRTMVAMEPRRGSALTIGDISMQLILDFASNGTGTDRTMNGPTTAAWLDPWEQHLRKLGVEFHASAPVRALELDGSRVTAALMADGSRVRGDYFVSALPIDAMHRLITPALAAADPQLARLSAADPAHLTAWMSGIQFFLYEDVRTARGHVFYPDSEWSLTSISQAQFWSEHGLFRKTYGNGEVGGILSVDISDFDTPGRLLGRPARECSAQEIADEVWEQLKLGLNAPGAPVLEDANLHSFHLDTDLVLGGKGGAHNGSALNRSVLLVHPPGSWAIRPEATTAIDNLVLAADYVRTHTNLATMEGANEAARRAVNAILERSGAPHDPAGVWPLEEPTEFARLRALDERRQRAGKPHIFELIPFDALFSTAELARKIARLTGIAALDDVLDRYKLTRLFEAGLRRIR